MVELVPIWTKCAIEVAEAYYCREQDHWPSTLPEIQAKHNGTIHDSTGYSPFEMAYGFPMRMPQDLILRTDSMRQKAFADEDHDINVCNVPCQYKALDKEDFHAAEDYLTDEERRTWLAQNIDGKEQGVRIFNALMDIRDRIRNQASCNIIKAQSTQKKNYDLKHQSGPKLQVGDLVRRETMANKDCKGDKLSIKFIGPFEVAKIHANGNVKLRGAKDQNL